MILDRTIRLEAVLAASATSSEPQFHIIYRDYNLSGQLSQPSISRGAMTSVVDTVLLSPPTALQGNARAISKIQLFNKDSAPANITIKTDNSLTAGEFVVINASLSAGESIIWDENVGWYAMDATGGRK